MYVITPTVGRIVHYYPGSGDAMNFVPGKPVAAIITHVWSGSCVNLSIFDMDGRQFAAISVALVQPADPAPIPGYSYCTWMDYQIGLVQNTEELQKQVDESSGD